MVTIVDTIRAVSGFVERTFGEPPTTKDITEGFTRPCTYVQPVIMQTEPSGGMRHDMYQIQIIRFASRSSEGYLELLEYQETLTEALEKPIPLDGEAFFVLYPENVDFELRRDEMVLITEFTADNFQLRPAEDADAEAMETLNLNGKD